MLSGVLNSTSIAVKTIAMVVASCADAAVPATTFLAIGCAAHKEAAAILEKDGKQILEGLLLVLVLECWETMKPASYCSLFLSLDS